MKITINGDSFEIDLDASLHHVLEQRCFLQRAGIAVALNNVVIPKNQWATTILKENDRVLIIAATKGG